MFKLGAIRLGASATSPRRTAKAAGAACLVALCFVIASCKNGASGSDSETVPSVAKNQTLTVGVASLLQQYVDPILANEGGGNYAMKWAIGEPLIRQDLNLKPIPALATSWDISPDKKTWTFHLRKGVKMQDGSEFTANDVATSIKRVQQNSDMTSYATYASKVASVQVVDDLTIQIASKAPYATLGLDTPPPVATAYYNKVGEQDFRKRPVAAGQFKLVSQKYNDSVTLERFDDFWDSDRKPNFKTLVVKIVPEESSRIAGLISGQLDMITGLTPNGIAQLQGNGTAKLIRSKEAQTATVNLVDGYNHPDSKLTDVRVRKALLMGLDREALAKGLYKGMGSVPNNLTYSVTLGNDPSLKAVPYDPNGARALLKEAGAGDLRFTVNSYSTTSSYPDVQKFAEAVVGQWKDLGVNVDLNIMDPANYVDKMTKHQLDGATVQGAPSVLFSADPSKTYIWYGANGPYSATKDPKWQQLFADLDASVDEGERTRIATEMSQYAYESLYVLPVVRLDAVSAIGPKVAEWTQMEGNPYAGPFWYLRAK
ncbi:ABC transporter substrate-binding protein [Dactylosporangium sp. CA-233914]|uniref:ABC transporter substrate-binding protein n=1 Tax=Dactylosporangium sp. CA-233914 TaxID=3239934 RepID=UPI003D92828F